jgi:hypothetical protein
VLLVAEGLLWLSDQIGWPAWQKGFAVMTAAAAVGAAMFLMLIGFVAKVLLRWRYQFSIRSLLLLVPLVAIPCSWMAVEIERSRKQMEAVRIVEELHGWVVYDKENISAPRWIRVLLGNSFFQEVRTVNLNNANCTPGTLERIRALSRIETLLAQSCTDHPEGLEFFPHLKKLDLRTASITDDGLEHVATLTQLEELDLNWTGTTDRGIAHLECLTHLRTLGLNGTHITDKGLARLHQMPCLEELAIDRTKVTDAGIPWLRRLVSLRVLRIRRTEITPEGANTLQRELPRCKIIYESSKTPEDTGGRV